jgi:hypothetical protein
VAYGDAVVPRARGGRDTVATNLENEPFAHRELVGGKGADIFQVTATEGAEGALVIVRDFKPGQGDLLGLGLNDTLYHDWLPVMDQLDTNDDGELDASDGTGTFGSVGFDGSNLSITMGLEAGADQVLVLGATRAALDWDWA